MQKILTQKELSLFKQMGTILSSNPGKILLGWGNRSWVSVPQDLSQPHFYFPDFFLTSPTPWFTHEHTKEVSLTDFCALLQGETLRPNPIVWHAPSKESFLQEFELLQSFIQSGSLQKGVPYTLQSSRETMPSDQLHLSLQAAVGNAMKLPLHLYGFWEENGGGILGTTPETLFKKHYAHVEVDAIAGTSPAEAADLSQDAKIVREHALVIKGICESLSPFGEVSTSPLERLPLGLLVHLKAKISLTLHSPLSTQALVDALHPTPALGAFPRLAGALWLRALGSRLPRGRFGAPVGVQWKDHSLCYVAIRNMQWNPHEVTLAAGCGIIAESDFEQEWDEVNLKLKSIKTLLGL